MSKTTWTYLYGVLACACALAVASFAHASVPSWHTLVVFAVLLVAASIAQLRVAEAPGFGVYHVTLALMIPAALLLPPALIVVFCVGLHLPEWCKERYRWFIQSFNIANALLYTFTAWGFGQLVDGGTARVGDPAWALAAAGAALGLVAVNHLLLGVMLRLARGASLRRSGVFSFDSLALDVGLTALGVAFVVAFQINPLLMPLMVAPVALLLRALTLPALREQSRSDAKTGLYNAVYFSEVLAGELASERGRQRTAVVMADLDFLREVNNTHGHLAGDVVIAGVARILAEQVRSVDLAARFGGEEFALMLRGASPEEALAVAQRIRAAVEEAGFEVPGLAEPLRATVTLGVAGAPWHGREAAQLIHAADVALYRAKAAGRNRAELATPADCEAQRPAASALPAAA
jgi:diguanylate cyclase (GGDEF)-like protein